MFHKTVLNVLFTVIFKFQLFFSSFSGSLALALNVTLFFKLNCSSHNGKTKKTLLEYQHYYREPEPLVKMPQGKVIEDWGKTAEMHVIWKWFV